MRISTVATRVLLLAALALACSESAQEGDGRGVVRALAADRQRITLEHGDIPGLMGAMKMEFELADPALAGAVAVGDEVEFRLRYADGAYTVTALRPASP